MVRRESVERVCSGGCRDPDGAEWNAHGSEVLSMGLLEAFQQARRDAGLDISDRIEVVSLVQRFGREQAMQQTTKCVEAVAAELLSRRR